MKKFLLLFLSAFALIMSAYPYAQITIPKGSKIQVGSKSGTHYVAFTMYEPTDIDDREEESDTYYYDKLDAGTYNLKVSSTDQTVERYRDHVAYATKFTIVDGENYVLNLVYDEETGMPLVDIDNGEVKSALGRGLKANSNLNVADIYLNGNYSGNVRLAPTDENGDVTTFQIVNLRNWQITDNTTNNYFLEPDYHYTVLGLDGKVSNEVLTVDENGLVTVNKGVTNGDAIVLVSYDALKAPGQLGGGDMFSSIWPENIGVLVFSVREKDQNETIPNITIHEGYNKDETQKVSTVNVDSELDVFYYPSSNGAYEYTFTPDNVIEVEIANPTIDKTSVSYSGFKAVDINKDGSYTLSLTEGRNIVKLIGKQDSAYYILKAKPVEISLTNNTTKDNTKFKNGDNVTVKFTTLYHPANKLAGVYNMYAQLIYQDEVNSAEVKGSTAQYQFAVTEKAQSITFDIKTDDAAKEFSLTGGRIQCTLWGDPYGAHRDITYEVGKNPNLKADSRTASFAGLPDIVLPLERETSLKQIAEEGDYVLNLDGGLLREGEDPLVYDTGGKWEDCYQVYSLKDDLAEYQHYAEPASNYWYGFCPAKNGDKTDYFLSSSNDWRTHQWGNMAGYGVAMGEDSLSAYVYADGTGVSKDGAAYLVCYAQSNKAEFLGMATVTFAKDVKIKGAYIAASPWAYYGASHGDTFSKAFSAGTDHMTLMVAGYKDGKETAQASLKLLGYDETTSSVTGGTDWVWFDMTSLGQVDKIDFCFDSSIYSDYGSSGVYLDHATYFCLDKLVATPVAATAVEETAAAESKAVRAGEYLYGVPEGSDVYLYDVSGSLLAEIGDAEGQVHLPVTAPAMIIKVVSGSSVQTLR